MNSYFQKTTHAAPLAIFRIALGLLLFGGVVRVWSKGWIDQLYIQPKYFFSYYGFEFVKPLGEFTYLMFAVCAISAVLVALGLYYRSASVLLFLSFTYIELIDKSTYLNHYYFISMICLMMIFLPAHAYFSIDALQKKVNADYIPKWCIDSLKVFVCIVYVFAGLAKLNSDWLLEAQPLRIWLPAKNDLPLIGWIFNYTWVAYMFSWVGCLYDLSIPFLLLAKKTRLIAYSAVLMFHVLTAVLFPIGMFPYIMIATALIFFSAGFHKKIIEALARLIRIPKKVLPSNKVYAFNSAITSKVLIICFCLFLCGQVIFPMRYLVYPGELFWTEQGYRFSWRVMLMEKAGAAQFIVKDSEGSSVAVDNTKFLTPLQEKMMSTQPDMILQYAHMLRDHYASQGFKSPEVYVDSYVTLNGRLGRPLIDSKVDLAKETDTFFHKPWILSFNNEIAGF